MNLDHREHLENLDHKDNQDLLAQEEKQDRKVHKDLKDLLAHLDKEESLDLLDHLVRKTVLMFMYDSNRDAYNFQYLYLQKLQMLMAK